MTRNLSQAVEDWIRAEYLFRHGAPDQHPYSGRLQDMLIEAEGALRKAATGKANLSKAAKSLGSKPYVSKQDEVRARRETQDQVKAPKRKLLVGKPPKKITRGKRPVKKGPRRLG